LRETRLFHVSFLYVKILKALWACLKELGVYVLFLKSHHYGMSPSFLFEKYDTIVTNSKTMTDLPHPTYKQVIPECVILSVVTMFCPRLKNDFSSPFPVHSSLVILSVEYYKFGRKSFRTLEKVSFTCHHLMELAVKLSFGVCVCVCVCVY